MARITDKNAQLNRWLARLFPPSSPKYAQPSELNEVIQLFEPALPSSLLYERMGFQTGVTAAGVGTELFFPSTSGVESVGTSQAGVPNGKFYWIAAARFSIENQQTAAQCKCFIALKNTASSFELGMAQGIWSIAVASFGTEFLDTHSPQATNPAAATISLAGGGGGAFSVPPGYTVHFSHTGTPLAGTVIRATVHYCVCDIGELHP